MAASPWKARLRFRDRTFSGPLVVRLVFPTAAVGVARAAKARGVGLPP